MNLTLEQIRDPEAVVSAWIKETPVNDERFARYCLLATMLRTGLCALCVYEDSAAREFTCSCRKPKT